MAPMSNLLQMPLSDAAQHFLDEIARRTHGFLGADLMELCRDAGLSTLRRSAGNLADHRADQPLVGFHQLTEDARLTF